MPVMANVMTKQFYLSQSESADPIEPSKDVQTNSKIDNRSGTLCGIGIVWE